MSTYNHTIIATGAAATAAVLNAPLSELDAAIKLNKYNGTAAPTTGDDTADGYSVGSRWIDTTNDRAYVCVDASLGAAVWELTSVPLATQTVDSSGRFLIGNSAGFNHAGINAKLQVYSATTSAASVGGATFGQFSADTRPASLHLSKSRNTSIAIGTVVAAADELGAIVFNGDDGSVLATGAHIKAIVDGTPGAGDMPTRLEFGVSADGSVSPTVALTIKATRSVILNSAAIATNATDGFLYMAACAGTPTGVPTSVTGRVPVVIDSTNNKMYIYSGGSWVALN